MPARLDLLRSNERTKNIPMTGSAARLERPSEAEPQGSSWDDDKVYQPDWEISAADLETYADIWSRD